ncbi:MAG: tetratricopeptide repeat protein, partial [Armatimonadetes bacterium]|nr:tetratricopeptide repeat protein [Armatimonadota bacterium]
MDAKGSDGHGSAVLDLTEYKQRLRVPTHDTTLDRAIHFHRARVLESRGQFDDAISAYKKVLELAPEDSVAYVRLANLYVQRGAPRAAVVVYVALAEMQAEKERWEKAALAYEKAAELAADDSEVHTALRDVYIKLGRLRDASKVQDRMDRIVKETPRGADLPVEPDVPTIQGQVPPTATRPPAPSKPAPAAPPQRKPPVEKPEVQEVEPEFPVHQHPTASPQKPAPPKPTPIRPVPPQPVQQKPVPPKPTPPPPARSAPRPVAQAPQPKAPEAGKRPRARTESLGQILLDEGMVTREQLEKA